MVPLETKVNTAAAAFIANVSDREMHRIIDERILPKEMFSAIGGRSFDLFACVLAAFYFAEEPRLTKKMRGQIISELMNRIPVLPKSSEGFISHEMFADKAKWKINIDTISVDLSRYARDAEKRAEEIQHADALVVSDDAILNGEPVFSGTRVPIRTIAAWVQDKIPAEEIKESYPGVTDEMLHLAPIWATTHPMRGRPKSFGDINPAWKVKTKHKVKLR
jgi:uncharacterized protein (DUF433 family)